MPRSISTSSRTDLLSGTSRPLAPIQSLGHSQLHGPARSSHIVVILGVGPGLGLSIARTFAQQGYTTVLMSRNLSRLREWAIELDSIARNQRSEEVAHPLSIAVQCDVLSMDSISTCIERTLQHFPSHYRIGTAIYNASVRKKAPFLEQTELQLQESLQASVLSSFVFFKSVITHMNQRESGGSILVTGATSSTRGREGFAAFSAGKTGLRRLCETAAREFGPDNIHIAHIIIDGLIDSKTAREYLLGRSDLRFPDSTVLIPDEIAKTYLFLAQQAPCAWTFEVDLRPAREKF